MTSQPGKVDRPTFLAGLALSFLACSLPVAACDTPLFRHALENWAADAYFVVVFHRGRLTPAQQEAVAYLRKTEATGAANLSVHLVDLDGQVERRMQELWNRLPEKNPPRMVVTYPFMIRPAEIPPGQLEALPLPPVVWTGPVTKAAAKKLVHSPLRKRIRDLLLEGQTAVWVLVECGDRAADQAAARTLTQELARMSSQLELGPEAIAAVSEGGPELKLSFSLVRLSADAADEKPLLGMLLGLERGLDVEHQTQPMAFAIFGRGRALTPLVGKGINSENIENECRYLIGACSCIVKQQNPGADLLVAADWEAAFADVVASPVALPPVASLAGIAEAAGAVSPDDDSFPVVRVAVICALVAIAVLVVVVGRRWVRRTA